MTRDGLWRPGAPNRFMDRSDAGGRLAERLADRLGSRETVVLALPRGGVPVAERVAERLGAPLDVVLVRKVGVPWQPELALGAVSTGGTMVFTQDVLAATGLAREEIEEAVRRELQELERRETLYRRGRPPTDVRGKTVVLVDDGIATGATVRAALRALRERGAARTVVACPVAPPETVASLLEEADEVIALKTPENLGAIGLWYNDFSPVPDEEVTRALQRRAEWEPPRP